MAIEFSGLLHLAAIYHEPLKARVCVHAGEVRFEQGDTSSLAINHVFKMEKRVKSGQLVLTEIAHKLALPSLFSEQCQFAECGTVRLDGYTRPVKLYRFEMKADMAFLIDKCKRGRLGSQ